MKRALPIGKVRFPHNRAAMVDVFSVKPETGEIREPPNPNELRGRKAR